MRRRTFLGGVAVTLPLAGCTGDGSDGAGTTTRDSDGTPTDEETPTPARTATDGDGSTPGGGATGGGETPTPTATPTQTSTTSPTATPPSAAQTVTVAADGFNFAPESFEVAAGETVRWVWEGGGHNVRPGEIPGRADWSGTPGGDSKLFDPGYEYTHTFEVAGEYGYYCAPHRDFGMTGSFTVTE